MTLPWEPPPPQQQQPVFHTPITHQRNINSANTNRTTPTTANNNSSSLGDFNVLLSFLQLERISLATPSTAAPPLPQPTTATATATTSAAPPSPPPAEGGPSSMIVPTWSDSPNDSSSATPSSSTYTSTTSRLGDLSLVMRYLQAHKAYNSFASADTLSPQDALNHTSSSSPTPTLSPLTQTIPSHDREPLEDAEDDEDTLATNRRRLKKKATRKLPIDEPSSSSCGGWVSSESDHKEEVMGRSPEEPVPVVLEDASNSRPPPNTIATITDFLAKELQHQYQQLQQQQQKLGQPMDNSTQQFNIHSLSTRTIAKPGHITLPQPLSVAANNKIAAPAAVVSANASGAGTAFIKKKRPWHRAKVLKEMKALFMEEQKRKHPQQQLPTLDNNRPASINTKPSIVATTTTTSTPITLVTPPKAAQREDERELVLDQTPGYEPKFQLRPRSHYNDFWRSCANNNTTITAATMTDTNRSSSSSSSSEEESPFRVTPWCDVTPASSSAFAFGSTTSTRPTSCLSEDTSKSAESKRLLALRVRDSFLVPRGIGLLDQALSRAESRLPEPVTSSPPQLEERPKPAPTTRLELGTMKSLTRIATPPSALPQPADRSRPAPATSASTEQQKIGPTPPPPSPPKTASATPSNERVFIFVDNSNILHGFYQNRQQLEAQRVVEGISVDGTSSSCARSRPEDGQDQHHNQDHTSPNKSLAHCTPTSPSEDGMALVTPTTTMNDDAAKSLLPGTSINSNGTSAGPKAKMAWGSHLLPKFNYSKFFDLLKRERTAARQVLVGSSPFFQELDEAMEHQYETIILRRVKKFVPGELGAVPVPVKQLRFLPSSFSISSGLTSLCDGAAPSVDKSTLLTTVNAVTPPTAAPLPPTTTTTTTATGSGSSGGRSQGEQGVDELLHLKMFETLFDHEPSTIVLASGDGGDSEFGGGGFYAVIKRALNRGWHVEIVSWEDQLSGVYLDLALEYGYNCEHKSAMAGGGKQCHALSSTSTSSLETVAVADGHKKQKKLKKAREGKQCGCGHLRVWCLDWYGDILLQPTPTPTPTPPRSE